MDRSLTQSGGVKIVVRFTGIHRNVPSAKRDIFGQAHDDSALYISHNSNVTLDVPRKIACLEEWLQTDSITRMHFYLLSDFL